MLLQKTQRHDTKHSEGQQKARSAKWDASSEQYHTTKRFQSTFDKTRCLEAKRGQQRTGRCRRISEGLLVALFAGRFPDTHLDRMGKGKPRESESFLKSHRKHFQRATRAIGEKK
jgi:hypothetical protein